MFPGMERSAREGIGYPLQYSWSSFVAQLVKNLPEMQETLVWSLGWDPPWIDVSWYGENISKFHMNITISVMWKWMKIFNFVFIIMIYHINTCFYHLIPFQLRFSYLKVSSWVWFILWWYNFKISLCFYSVSLSPSLCLFYRFFHSINF